MQSACQTPPPGRHAMMGSTGNGGQTADTGLHVLYDLGRTGTQHIVRLPAGSHRTRCQADAAGGGLCQCCATVRRAKALPREQLSHIAHLQSLAKACSGQGVWEAKEAHHICVIQSPQLQRRLGLQHRRPAPECTNADALHPEFTNADTLHLSAQVHSRISTQPPHKLRTCLHWYTRAV